MKYLYYTLNWFYVNIIKLHKQYPPIINITAVIAVIINFLFFSLVKIYYYKTGYVNYHYSILFQTILTFFIWKLLYEYYKPREEKLLNEMNKKPLWLKVLIIILSLLFIAITIKLWMFDGSIGIYQFLKEYR